MPDNNQTKEFQKEFGRYQLMEKLGRGGMGVVYKAWDKNLNRVVAIKILLTDSDAEPVDGTSTEQAQSVAEEIKRFYREAQTAAKLHHPNIVQIYEVGTFGDRHFFSMEYLNGLSLRNIIRFLHNIKEDDIVLRDKTEDSRFLPKTPPRLPIRELILIIRDIALGLHYAHQHKIIHRDVKPENILVTLADDEEGVLKVDDLFTNKSFICKIADFGLVRDISSVTTLTLPGQLLGTPGYMSPEQVRAENTTIDERTDVFSLGIVLYEALTGKNPFQSKSIYHVLKYILEKDPMRPRQINKQIHHDLETIILKSMDKNPDLRYRTAKEFAEDLDRFLRHEPIHARPNSGLYRVQRFMKRHKEVTVTASIFLFFVGSITAYFFYQAASIQRDAEKQMLEKEEDRKQARAFLSSAEEILGVAEKASAHGERAVISKKIELARSYLDKAIAEDPTLSEAHSFLGYTYMLEDDYEEAVQHFNTALLHNNGNLFAHYNRGKIYLYLFSINEQLSGGDSQGAEDYQPILSADHLRAEKLAKDWKEFAISDFTFIKNANFSTASTAYSNAIISFLEGKFVQSLTELNRALVIDPYHPDALMLKGIVLNALGSRDEAIVSYTSVISENKNDMLAYFNRGALYAAQGRTDDAVADYLLIDSLYPRKYPVVSLKIGELLVRKGELEASLEWFTKAIDMAGLADAYFARGNVYLTKSMFEKALDDYAMVVKMVPNFPHVYNQQGIIYYTTGDQQRALECFTKAIGIEPDFKEALINKANTLKALQRYSDAEEAYINVIDAFPESNAGYFNLGKFYNDIGRYERSLPYLDRAIAIYPNFIEALLLRASILIKTKSYERALDDYASVLMLDETNFDALLYSAKICINLGRLDASAGFLASAEQVNPRSVQVKLWKGIGDYYQGRYERADAGLSEVISEEPGNPEALKFRGLSRFKIGAMGAEEDILSAITAEPFDPELYYWDAQILYSKKMAPKAIESLKKALNISPAYPDALLFRGFIYLNSGDFELGLKDVESLLSANPESHQALALKARILSSLGRNEEAVVCLDKAIGIESSEVSYHYYRGLFLFNIKAYQRAIKDFDMVVSSPVAAPESYKYMGICKMNLKETASAVMDLEAYLKLVPDDPEGSYYHGLAMIELGQYDKAKVSLDSAIGKKTDYVDALFSRGTLRLNVYKDEKSAADDFKEVLRLAPNHPFSKDIMIFLSKYKKD